MSTPARLPCTPHARQRHTQFLALALGTALALAGCENMGPQERGTAQGAGIGAAAGAVIGAATGNGRSAATGALLGAAVGAIGGNLWSKRMEERQRKMEQATQGTGVDVSRTEDNQLKLNVPSDISFDTGSATLKPELRTVLQTFSDELKGDHHSLLRIVGHTDSTGSDAINNPLSEQRAESVRNFLVDRGLPSQRIETIGRGSREPVADNASEAGRARNRRVEIFLREPEAQG